MVLSVLITFITLQLEEALSTRWMFEDTREVIFKTLLENHKMGSGNSLRD